MHNLKPLTALGGAVADVQTVGTLTISEVPDLALASVAARLGREKQTLKTLKTLVGATLPGPGKASLKCDIPAMWIGPDQWMLSADYADHETLFETVAGATGADASVTEQSDGWVCFDISGSQMPAMCELLCPVDIHGMAVGDATRSTIHQMGCFICRTGDTELRVIGPRSSAGSLHHALIAAAHSVA